MVSLEMAKGEGEGRHPAAMWANAMQQPVIGGSADAPAAKPANNAMRAMLAFAYNLYLIEHHYKQYDQPLFKRLLKRLHDPSEFFPTPKRTRRRPSLKLASTCITKTSESGGITRNSLQPIPRPERNSRSRSNLEAELTGRRQKRRYVFASEVRSPRHWPKMFLGQEYSLLM